MLLSPLYLRILEDKENDSSFLYLHSKNLSQPFLSSPRLREREFDKRGGILAANHSSYLDPPIIGVSCPQEVHFLARDTLFKSPLFGWLIRALNTHPVKRGQGNIAAMKKALEFIEEGKKVVIFPEGTRSPTGDLQKGQAGIGLLVQRSHCKVFPIYIHGTFDIWSIHRSKPLLKGQTACVFGKPLAFHISEETDKKEAHQQIINQIMGAIAKLQEWYLAGAKGTPP